MIKKLFFLAAITCFSSSFAQNIELRLHGGSSALINDSTITITDTLQNDINQDVPVEIDAKSKFLGSKDIKVKKIELTTTAPSSKNAICWGTCTIPATWGTHPVLTSDKQTMASSQTILYSGHLYPQKIKGNSSFKYVFFDDLNPTDSTFVIVNFVITDPSSGINEIKKETSVILYPNPATTNLTIDLNSNEDNKKIEIIDLLGKKVFTKNVISNSSKFNVNTSNFKPGIYFVSVTSNSKAIQTKKIVITK